MEQHQQVHRETIRVVSASEGHAEAGSSHTSHTGGFVSASGNLSPPTVHFATSATRLSGGGGGVREDSPPYTASSILSPSRTDEVIDTALQAAQRRQNIWDQQLESVDQKQAELLTIQWKLIREQVGTVSREVALIQNEVKDLKADSRKAVLEVERRIRDTETKVEEERVLRATLSETMDQQLQRLRADLSLEAKNRVAGDKEVSAKMDVFGEEFDKLARQQGSLEQEMSRLQSEIAAALQQGDALREAITKEGIERQAISQNLLDRLGELRVALVAECQDRANADDELIRGLRDLVEKERADRSSDVSILRNNLSMLQKEFAPGKEEMVVLGNRITDLESTFLMQLKDLRESFNKAEGDNQGQYTRLEKRILELSKTLEKEGASRAALAEETEQMLKSFRVKIRAQLEEKVEAARAAREQLGRSLQDQLDKEISAREAQGDNLSSEIQGNRVAFSSKLDALQKQLTDVELQLRDQLAKHVVDWEEAHTKLFEELSKQIRDLRDTLMARLNEERLNREAADGSLEEHLEFLDRFLQDVRDLFMQKGTWQRKLVRTKPVSTGNLAVTSSITTNRSMLSSQAASPLSSTP